MSREVVTLAKKTKGEYSYNEAIKTLRTNVQFCGSNLRRILLTSAFPDEGKSDVTFALASSLAQIFESLSWCPGIKWKQRLMVFPSI